MIAWKPSGLAAFTFIKKEPESWDQNLCLNFSLLVSGERPRKSDGSLTTQKTDEEIKFTYTSEKEGSLCNQFKTLFTMPTQM